MLIVRLTFFTAYAASALGSFLPSSPQPIERYQGKATGIHIVTLKEGASRSELIRLAKGTSNQAITELDIINGFSGYFDDNTLSRLRSHPDVALVSEDGIMHTMSLITQTNAPWGIARLSSTGRLSGPDTALNFTYTYDSSAGGCADIYVVDTGIYTGHSDFGGRAYWGGTWGGNSTIDGNGHGTHCAATAVGTQFGVAKKALIYSVKVLSDAGSGSITDIISGLNWILTSARKTGRPSVVLMAIGGGASTALDNAVTTLTSAGIHVAAAAGNSNTDAGSSSPGRVPSVITVGATNIADQRISSSNYGSAVDIYAPGWNIISAWIDSPTSIRTLSGTSSAAAHVAGLIAYLICLEGNISPAAMSTKLKDYAIKGALGAIPSGSNNNLAHNSP